MLNIKDAIRIQEYMPPSRAITHNVPLKKYIFKCEKCQNEIKVGKSRLKTATGLCVVCNNKKMHPMALEARRLRPFEALFRRVMDSAARRNIEISINYDDFLIFIKIDVCHYCYSKIKWTSSGNSTYNLDRKNNSLGYSKENLVVCCGKCNKGKRELFSYEEWYGMTEYFRKLNGVCGL